MAAGDSSMKKAPAKATKTAKATKAKGAKKTMKKASAPAA